MLDVCDVLQGSLGVEWIGWGTAVHWWGQRWDLYFDDETQVLFRRLVWERVVICVCDDLATDCKRESR